MPVTIEQLLLKHFWPNDTDFGSIEPKRGKDITRAEAMRLTSHLSSRQRQALSPDALEALEAVFVETPRHPQKRLSQWESELKSLKAFGWWKQLRTPDREQAWITIVVVFNVLEHDRRLGSDKYGITEKRRWHVRSLCHMLGKKILKFTPEQLLVAIETSEEQSRHAHRRQFNYEILSPIMKYMDALRTGAALTKSDRTTLEAVREQLVEDGYGSDSRTAIGMLNTILGEGDKDLLWDGEAWAEAINKSLHSIAPGLKANYTELLRHAGSVGFTKPSRAWFSTAQKLAAELDPVHGADQIGKWIGVFTASRRAELGQHLNNVDDPYTRTNYDNRGRFESNLGYATGLVYLARLFPTSEVIAQISNLVEHVSRWQHYLREDSMRVAAAGVRVLEMIESDGAVAALSRLELRVRWPKLRKSITKALEGAIIRCGGSRDEIEETVVPDFGMTDGTRRDVIGDAKVAIAMARGDRPTITWHISDKEPTHTVPKWVRDEQSERVAELKALAVEIEKMHTAQRTRIDLLFRKPRVWKVDEWRDRYLNHGLLCGMTRRLIWSFDGTPAIWNNGAVQSIDGSKIDLRKTKQVELWHPVLQKSAEVVAWREHLERMNIAQPIKQAHREIYILTEAELRTKSYSNRFAAHVLRNHTALAITQVRKWKMGLYGGAASPSITLPGFNIRSEWWVNPAGDEHDRMGFPLYLASDQVRFYRDADSEPMPLEQVPRLAFSEVMRDVDLFVGIASVGNDPNWADGGEQVRFRTYWQNYSFGDLSATAKTRKEVLERLVPRLKIASQCSISDKFLVVRGQKRTYKVHLGSGNILMEPNDQYLCIVPDSRTRAGEKELFLPFEGDGTLSIIISKAMLLAEDSKISDPTITRQIGN